jgi:hypothetical protein
LQSTASKHVHHDTSGSMDSALAVTEAQSMPDGIIDHIVVSGDTA